MESYPDVFGFASAFSLVLPKFKLAEKFVPDFLVVGIPPYSQSHTPTVTMVELEHPTMQLFTKAGDQTSQLSHAIRQVQDWRQWVRENHSYLRAELARRVAAEPDPAPLGIGEKVVDLLSERLARGPLAADTDLLERLTYGFGEQYLIVAGRRAALDVAQKLRLEEINRTFNCEIDIVTYDVLLDYASGRVDMLHFSG